MMHDERRPFEEKVPTPQPYATPLTFWEEELRKAAFAGDLPRMKRAVEKGAAPNFQGCFDTTLAHLYALGPHHNLHDDQRPFLSSHQIEHIWAWFKTQGVPMYTPGAHDNSVWDILYTRGAIFAHPVEAKCAEVNLWALWKNLSLQARSALFEHLDALFFREEEPTCVQPLLTVEGFPPVASAVMKEALTFKGIDTSVYGKTLSPFERQDRVLALSSLLSAKQGIPVENTSEYASDFMVLGLWGYAPAPVLQDLARLPSYHHTLSGCLTRIVSTFHTITAPGLAPENRKDSALVVARRLARGVRTHLQNGFEFSQEDLKALMTLNEVRPLLEEHLLKNTLNAKRCTASSQGSFKPRTRL